MPNYCLTKQVENPLVDALDPYSLTSRHQCLVALSTPSRLAWPRTSPSQGGDTGSNPVGAANIQTVEII